MITCNCVRLFIVSQVVRITIIIIVNVDSISFHVDKTDEIAKQCKDNAILGLPIPAYRLRSEWKEIIIETRIMHIP